MLGTEKYCRIFCVALWVALLLLSTDGRAEESAVDTTPVEVESPLTAADSLKQFQLHPDLRIELVAAEPDVIDPVAIAFDEEGRMWVVEMRDYPNGPAEGEQPKSRISVLEDRNGDGTYDSAHVFVDNLLFATGLQVWRGGLIATVAGEVIYLKDSDGDGRADVRETWFSGFAQKNVQLRANHPTFALDNQIYVANGLRGGSVTAQRPGWERDQPISISGMDFRFDPLTGRALAISGAGQFGLTFDDYGNRFICSNRNPCMHVVLANHYIKRNPYLAVGSVVHDVSPAAATSRVYAISKSWTTSTLHAGQITAACGVTIYRGDALPKEFQGNSFTCEPTGNLVHRDVLHPQGATFRSHPGRENVEFLASPDTWFRPVNLTVGPDGALYVVDMYRAVIEHPQWMPEELKDRRDLEYGNDRGRIWRIVRRDSNRQHNLPQVSTASAEELVGYLEHDNAWWRETAQRLLIERQDRSQQQALEKIAIEGAHPTARVHALWTLSGLGMLSSEFVMSALNDPHPRVREQAVRLAERKLKDSAPLRERLLQLATDQDPRLRFQVALSLGEAPLDDKSLSVLAKMLGDRSDVDVWTQHAIASSAADQVAILLIKTLDESTEGITLAARLKDLSAQVGSRQQPEEIATVLQRVLDNSDDVGKLEGLLELQTSVVSGLGEGLQRRGMTLRQIANKFPPELAKVSRKLDEFFGNARDVAADSEQEQELRMAALGVLRYATFDLAGSMLMDLVEGDESQEMTLAAIDVLAGFHDERIGRLLLDGFRSRTPAVRRAVLAALLRNSARIQLLLDEIEAGGVSVVELGAATINQLTRLKNQELRTRATKLLAGAIPADRKQVLAAYQPALTMEADPNNGRKLFEKNCSVCHRIGTLGVEIGPDIADSRTRQPAALLTDILNPNRAIDANYVSYSVQTTQGKTITGIIATETASSLTIKQQENKRVTVLRQDIEEIVSNGVSLMPDGLEKNISVQEMADLISFIKNWRYLDGSVPLRER